MKSFLLAIGAFALMAIAAPIMASPPDIAPVATEGIVAALSPSIDTMLGFALVALALVVGGVVLIDQMKRGAAGLDQTSLASPSFRSTQRASPAFDPPLTPT